jgi:hypothetical protein
VPNAKMPKFVAETGFPNGCMMSYSLLGTVTQVRVVNLKPATIVMLLIALLDMRR